MRLKNKFFYFGLVIIVSVSCQSESEVDIVTASYANVVTQTVIPSSSLIPTSAARPTVTINVKPTSIPVSSATTITTETVTPNVKPTSIPVSTATTIATKTVTPIITAITLTPLPTFTTIDLETAVAELSTDPMNCEAPCWWGAIPGETTFYEIQQFLALYEFTDYVRHMEKIPDDRFSLWMGFDEDENRYDYRVRYGFKNTVLTSLVSEQAPRLSNILRKYGKPDEIWLETKSYKREGNLSVRLNLVYLHMGMAVGYVVDGDIKGDIVTGCFADKETGHLHLLVPDVVTSYKNFIPIFELERHYLLLEEATSLTMDDFMQQFSDPSQPQCIETPTELWE